MNRTEELFGAVKADIVKGKYGVSGSRFITARDFVGTFKCSSRDAMRVFERLKEEGLIRAVGGGYYVCTGFCKPATSLRRLYERRQKNIFGVLVNNINNPFFSSVIQSLQSVACENKMQLIVSDGGGIPNRERNIMDMFFELGCVGVFNCSSLSSYQQPYFARYPLPIVTIAEDVHLPNADTVLVDNFNAGKQVAEHLMSCGCRSFYYFALDDCIDSDKRFEGYYHRLAETGQLFPDENIGIVSNAGGTIDTGHVKQLVSSLIRRLDKHKELLPIGIFCHHDMLAVEVIRSIKSYNYRRHEQLTIPRDVMIVGFDDLPITQAVSPTVTTMAYLYADIAKTAFDVMMDYINNSKHTPTTHKVTSYLVIRESTVNFDEP